MGPGSTSHDDAELAFGALYEANIIAIWSFARRRVTVAADADDLTAETFAVAWRRRQTLPPLAEQRLWLFGVARNVLRNHQRSEQRQARTTKRLISLADAPGRASFTEPDRDPTLGMALAAMTDSDRDLLLMRAWDGLAVTEIAHLLDISPNAVSVRLSKARGRLRTLLDELETEATKDAADPGHVVVDGLTSMRGATHE